MIYLFYIIYEHGGPILHAMDAIFVFISMINVLSEIRLCIPAFYCLRMFPLSMKNKFVIKELFLFNWERHVRKSLRGHLLSFFS